MEAGGSGVQGHPWLQVNVRPLELWRHCLKKMGAVWDMPLIPSTFEEKAGEFLGGRGVEGSLLYILKSQASQGYIVRCCLKKGGKKARRGGAHL